MLCTVRNGQMAEKLDSLMLVAFQYIARHGASGVSDAHRDHMFHLVLGVFEKNVLHTFKYVGAIVGRALLLAPRVFSCTLLPCPGLRTGVGVSCPA